MSDSIRRGVTESVFGVLLVTLLAFGSSGCVGRPQRPLSTEESRVAELPVAEADSVDELSLTNGISVSPNDLGVTPVVFDEPSALLRGPHFTVRTTWVAVGPTIDGPNTRLVPGLTPRRAATGQELVVIATDTSPGQWTLGTHPQPTTHLVIDGEKTLLPRLSALNDRTGLVRDVLVVASVPARAPLQLTITDADRVQTLDVRKGRRGTDEIPGYYRTTSQPVSYSAQIPVTARTAGTTYSMVVQVIDRASGDTTDKNVMLAPWAPHDSWAGPGRAWLVVPTPLLVTEPSQTVPGLVLNIDESTAYRLRLPTGEVVRDRGGTRKIETLYGRQTLDNPPLVFDVPADFTTGTFEMDMAAMQAAARFAEGDFPVTWRTPPATFTVPVNM